MDPSSERSKGWNFVSCKEVLLVYCCNIIVLGDVSFSWGEEGLLAKRMILGQKNWLQSSLIFLDINKAIQVFLHIFVCFMIYVFVLLIYIWSYIFYDSKSLFLDSVMLLWFHRCSLKLGWQGSEWQRSIRRERNQTRNQAQDWGWCPLFPSYLLSIKENKNSFCLFVSKIATNLSGTSNST